MKYRDAALLFLWPTLLIWAGPLSAQQIASDIGYPRLQDLSEEDAKPEFDWQALAQSFFSSKECQKNTDEDLRKSISNGKKLHWDSWKNLKKYINRLVTLY